MARPKRLWAAVLLNVAAGGLSLAVVGLFVAKLVPVAGIRAIVVFLPDILISGVLITASIFALRGNDRSRWIALGTAVAFFGLHLIQSLWYYYHPSQVPFFDTPSLASNVERAAIGIVVNLWGFLSEKTDAFFDAAAAPERL